MININKVIIWGHELHNHTHSYIHNGFYIGFKYMGYDTYWFNRNGKNNLDDNIIDFENSLYITHGLECENLPINKTSVYISHNVEWIEISPGYKLPKNHNLNIINVKNGVESSKIITLQVLNIDSNKNAEMYNEKKYYYANKNIIYMPWATDLLPYEIYENIEKIENFKIKNISNFIGMPLEHNQILKNALTKNNIKYANYGGTFDVNSNRNKSIKENMELIQESIIAPALQSQWQIDNHYIPCRIFKNISYGKMGMTNSNAVNELFDNELLYSKDIEELVNIGLDFEKRKDKNEIIKKLMINVAENHTYINRITYILDVIKQFHNIEIQKQLK